MKILNTVQELWDYCLFCPVCQEDCRKMTVSVGPDDTFEVITFEKSESTLTLNCLMKKRRVCKYIINCADNTFRVFYSNQNQEVLTEKSNAVYFYFYLSSNCQQCHKSYTNSNDLELDVQNYLVCNVGIEREGIQLITQSNGFHITKFNYFDSSKNEMLISRCLKQDGELMVEDKFIRLPSVDLDFSNPEKVVNKILTLLTFS